MNEFFKNLSKPNLKKFLVIIIFLIPMIPINRSSKITFILFSSNDIFSSLKLYFLHQFKLLIIDTIISIFLNF